jgi:hypothetical protein
LFQAPVGIKTSAGLLGTFTQAQLDNALSNNAILNSVFRPYLQTAINIMIDATFSGKPMVFTLRVVFTSSIC